MKQIELTPAQSHVILRKLVDNGMVQVSEVRKAFKEAVRDVAKMHMALSGTVVTRRTKLPAKGNGKGKAAARLKLHGKYMGLVRSLPKEMRLEISKIRQREGIQAAIDVAQKARDLQKGTSTKAEEPKPAEVEA